MKIENEMKLQFYPYKIFSVDGINYLYTVNASGVFEINEEVLRILGNEGNTVGKVFEQVKDIFTYQDYITTLNEMQEENLLIADTSADYAASKIEMEEKYTSLILMLIQECNMRCTYCYGEGGEYNDRGIMTEETALKAVDYMIESTNAIDLYIAFFGGEPLLNYTLIKKVVQHCEEYKKDGKNFHFTITTNGSLLNEEIEKFLINNGVRIQISIDGVKEKHNKNRILANGKGSYDLVLQNTKKLRENSILTARATASNGNLNCIEIFEHLYSIGFPIVTISIAHNCLNDSELSDYLEEYKKYIYHFYKLVKSKQYKKALAMNDVLMQLKKIEFGSKRTFSCGVAKNMSAVDISGNLFPCHRFVANKEFSLGDIYTGENEAKEKFISNISIDKHNQCKECWAKNLCLGGCPNENFVETGEINKTSVRNCQMTQIIYETLLKVYVKLTDSEKQILFTQTSHIDFSYAP